jgi:hypothetical protein
MADGGYGVRAGEPTSTAKHDPQRRRTRLSWLPIAVLGAGLVLGVALWAKWGLAVAFETIRTYCF